MTNESRSPTPSRASSSAKAISSLRSRWPTLLALLTTLASPTVTAQDEAPAAATIEPEMETVPLSQPVPTPESSSELVGEPPDTPAKDAAADEDTVGAEDADDEEVDRLLILDAKNNGADRAAIAALPNTLASEIAQLGTVEVISGADLRRMAELESERMALGCEAESCIAEIAGALGARLVIFSEASRVGSTTVVNLSIFDVNLAKALSRVTVRVEDVGELPDQIVIALPNLVAPLLGEPASKDLKAKLAKRVDDAKARLEERRRSRLMGGRAMVVVKSNPSGAELFVDGRLAGLTPLTLEEVAAGEHVIEAKMKGMIGRQTINAAPGDVLRLNLNLSQGLPVSVRVVSSPPDATILLDGKKVGVAPLVMPSVPAGERVFRAVLKGRRSVTRTIELDSGAWEANGGKALRVSLKLPSDESARTMCVNGDSLVCAELAAEALTAGDSRRANSLFVELCEFGYGNYCAHAASFRAERDPNGAISLAHRACFARFALGCELRDALLEDDRIAVAEALDDLASLRDTKLTGGKPDHTYEESDDEDSRDPVILGLLCDEGYIDGCRDLATVRGEEALAADDERQAYEKGLERIDMLRRACELEPEGPDCRRAKVEEQRFTARHSSIWRPIATLPLVGAAALGWAAATVVLTGASLLPTFFLAVSGSLNGVTAAISGLLGTPTAGSGAVFSTVALALALPGLITAPLILGGALFLASAVVLDWLPALATGAVAVAVGVALGAVTMLGGLAWARLNAVQARDGIFAGSVIAAAPILLAGASATAATMMFVLADNSPHYE